MASQSRLYRRSCVFASVSFRVCNGLPIFGSSAFVARVVALSWVCTSDKRTCLSAGGCDGGIYISILILVCSGCVLEHAMLSSTFRSFSRVQLYGLPAVWALITAGLVIFFYICGYVYPRAFISCFLSVLLCSTNMTTNLLSSLPPRTTPTLRQRR